MMNTTKMAFRADLAAATAIVIACLVSVNVTSSVAATRIPTFCQGRSVKAIDNRDTRRKGGSDGSARTVRRLRVAGVVLLVSTDQVDAGQSVFARLVNRGSRYLGYGLEFHIERYTTARGWFVDPASPPGPWPKVGGRLNPGFAGRCYGFHVPADQPRGHYRFSTKVEVLDRPRSRPIRRTGEFDVR